MLVAARTGDKTIETDLFMAEITLHKVDVAHEFAAFFAKGSTVTAKMSPAFQTPEGVFNTKMFSTKMTLDAAFLAHPFSAISTAYDSTIQTDMRSAAAACFQTRLTGHMKTHFTNSDSLHLLAAR